MTRILALAAAVPLLVSCGPPDPVYVGFELTLNLNLAGDGDLLDDLEVLEVAVFSPDEGPLYYSWDWFDAESALVMEDIPRGDGVVFEVRGLIGGDEVAAGTSEPMTLPPEDGDGEVWVLFHRHGTFLPLEGGSDYPRLGHRVIAVEGGAAVIGGETGDGYAPISRLVRTEHAGYALESWATAPELSGFAAARLLAGDFAGQVFIAGGATSVADFEGISSEYSIWDPVSGEYTVDGEPLTQGMMGGEAVALGEAGGDGRVVLVGGASSYNTLTSEVSFRDNIELVDPAEGEIETEEVGEWRWYHTAVLWGPDITVVCGGYNHPPWEDIMPQDSCDTYTAVSNTWADGDGALQHGRAGHGAAVLPGTDGDRILLVGGTERTDEFVPHIESSNEDVLADAEIVESVGGSFSTTRVVDMIHPRVFPLVLRIPDQEKVLVCGGHDGGIYRADCEYFDEDTETFAIAEGLELPMGVNFLSGAVLDDGSILIVGGNAGAYEPADLAVLYLP